MQIRSLKLDFCKNFLLYFWYSNIEKRKEKKESYNSINNINKKRQQQQQQQNKYELQKGNNNELT